MNIDGCTITLLGGDMPEAELMNYIARGREKYGARLEGLEVKPDGEYVELRYKLKPVPFQRIRRITGYLVGSLDHFNNGKRAEERDRVKHNICC